MWEDIKKFFKTSFKWIIKIVLGLIGLVLLITLIAHLYDNYQEQVVEEDYLVCGADNGLLTRVLNQENIYLKFEHTREKRFAKGFFMYPVRETKIVSDQPDPDVYLPSLIKTDSGWVADVYLVHRYSGFKPKVTKDRISKNFVRFEEKKYDSQVAEISLNRENLSLTVKTDIKILRVIGCEITNGTRFNDNLRKLQEYEASKNQI